jgi:predicted ferric reductase
MLQHVVPGPLAQSVGSAFVKRGGLLSIWKTGNNTDLSYSHGLTGVDQHTNYQWVEVTAYLFLGSGLILLLLHVLRIFWRQMRHMSVLPDPTRQEYWKHNKSGMWPWLQRHVFNAPVLNKRHNRGFQLSSAIDNGTLPGRWQLLLLTIYFVFNIWWSLDLDYNLKRMEIVAALRGRTGTLAALNLVPTILFALRNNPLITLLQVSYDDFNLFHRWAARITIFQALIHTIAWLGNTVEGGSWKAIGDGLQEPSYTWGMVASCAFTFIGIQAWSPIRHAFYESFINIHRVMVILALTGLYLHLDKHHLPQLPWMNVVVVMWAVEWGFRLLRIFVYNFKLRGGFSQIKIEALPGEAVRVTVFLKSTWHPRPGCHAYISMPPLHPFLPWTSHPFSVAWAAPVESDNKEASLSNLEGQSTAPSAPVKSQQMSFICRARTGHTRKMYDLASKASNETITTWGSVEGPYGGHHSLDSYGTLVLFAGGVGITHQVMYLKHLVQGYHLGTTATQRLLLVWTVPETECLEWVRDWMDEILRMPGRKNVLRVKLFITRPKRQIENKSDTVVMYEGRPKTATLLQDELRNRVGAMAVTVCGSGAFADDVRAAARPLHTEGSLDFIEEAFTY